MDARRPGPHPHPPDLTGTALPLCATARAWLRHHPAEFEPVHFGRSGDNRFDAPGPTPAFGVLYLAGDAHGAFIETFGHSHVQRGTRIVTPHALSSKRLSEVGFARALRLVDLTEGGLARIGADVRLCAGDYDVSQAWSAALHDHPERPDGLLYRARHDPSRLCAAVYDRAADAVTSRDTGTLLDPDRAALLGDILDTYGFGLVG